MGKTGRGNSKINSSLINKKKLGLEEVYYWVLATVYRFPFLPSPTSLASSKLGCLPCPSVSGMGWGEEEEP